MIIFLNKILSLRGIFMTVSLPKKNLLDKILFLIFKEERASIYPSEFLKNKPYSNVKATKEPLGVYLKRVLMKK
jgi:hypothetical protein